MVVRCAHAVFNERANLELTQLFAESGLVVTLVRRSPAFRRAICSQRSASLPSSVVEQCTLRTAWDSVSTSFRDFERLYAVVGAVAVVATGAISFVERGVEGGVFGWIVQLGRLAQ